MIEGLHNEVHGAKRCLILPALALVWSVPVFAMAASLSWGDAKVVPAPAGFSYTISIVTFDSPRTLSIGAGVRQVSQAVQVVLQGQGFRPMATGPVIWLNGMPTLRTQVAEDGRSVTAYFLEPLDAYEAAATRLGRWELIYQPHEGANEVYRVSPTGDQADADSPPTIGRVSSP